ncbi:MAG: hypothetical protein ACI9DF_004538 [Verrucomicrobiales bacterium]|jgi:hypothetical protein
MRCGGGGEAWAVKQQPPDTPGEDFGNNWLANTVVLALSISGYLKFGFSGVLMPCCYARRKGVFAEVGIVYFGSPSPSGIEANEFEFDEGFDNRFGHGFGTMLTHFIKELQQASKTSPLTLQPWIGLEDRPRSLLETLGFDFLIHGPDVFCLKARVREEDPVWPVLRSTGIEEVYHLPSVPAEITEGQLDIAKPTK